MKELVAELAKDIKTGEDLGAFSAQVRKITVEAALGAEMEEHLGCGLGIQLKATAVVIAVTGQVRRF